MLQVVLVAHDTLEVAASPSSSQQELLQLCTPYTLTPGVALVASEEVSSA